MHCFHVALPAHIPKTCGIAGLLVSLLFVSNCGEGSPPVPSQAQIVQQLTSSAQSAHYFYHMSPDDSVDIQRQEAFHSWITAQLGISLMQAIQYYKYRDVAQKQALTGRSGNAFADPPNFSIHTIWNWDNHEVTHVLTATIGTPPSLFNEGMAVANQTDPQAGDLVPKWSSVPLHTRAKGFLQQGTLPSLDNIVESVSFSNLDPSITYPSAGSFVQFLIDRDGLPRALEMFRGAALLDPRATTLARFQQVYGQSLTQAEQDWHTFLQQLP